MTVTKQGSFRRGKTKMHLKWVLLQRQWKQVQRGLRNQQGPDLMPISIRISEPEHTGN